MSHSTDLPGCGPSRAGALLWAAMLLVIGGCGGGVATASGLPRGEAPVQLVGTFEDDYGIRYRIDGASWLQEPASRYLIHEWRPDERFVLARNAPDHPSDPGAWTRIDWIPLEGMAPWDWAFCLTVWDAETSEAAARAAAPDGSAPRTGCNGFPFSRMKRVP